MVHRLPFAWSATVTSCSELEIASLACDYERTYINVLAYTGLENLKARSTRGYLKISVVSLLCALVFVYCDLSLSRGLRRHVRGTGYLAPYFALLGRLCGYHSVPSPSRCTTSTGTSSVDVDGTLFRRSPTSCATFAT